MPELVVISPGVQVIADFHEPIFYSDNYYWRNDGGYWYRSRSHTRGWARVEVAPVEIRTIERPSAYVHYRGTARAHGSRDHRDGRDHREVVAPAPRHDDQRGKRDDKHDDQHSRRDDKRHDDKRHDDRRHDDRHDDDKRHDDKRHDDKRHDDKRHDDKRHDDKKHDRRGEH